MASERKPKPCPWCGSALEYNDEMDLMVCTNPDCRATGPEATLDLKALHVRAAITAWNRRAK